MKIARVYVRAMKEPLLLDEGKGKQIQNILFDDGIKNSDIVETENWVGKKEDIRGVKFGLASFEELKRMENEKYGDMPEAQEKIYTDMEIIEFQKELQPYMMKKGDEDYNKIIQILFENVKGQSKLFWSKILTEKINALSGRHLKDEDIQKEIENLMDEFFVGRLTNGGEDRYLFAKKVIKLNEYKQRIVLRYDNKVPFVALDNKLSAYKSYIGRKEYGMRMQMEQLDDLAIQKKVESLQGK